MEISQGAKLGDPKVQNYSWIDQCLLLHHTWIIRVDYLQWSRSRASWNSTPINWMSAIVKNILLPTTTIGEYFTSTILLGIYPVTTLQRICNIKKEPFDKLCFFLVDAAGAPWRRGEAHWHSPLKTVYIFQLTFFLLLLIIQLMNVLSNV